MSDQPQYHHGPGGVAAYDQLKQATRAQLRRADSWVLVTAHLDDNEPDGYQVEVISAVKTPFPPFFLAQAVNLVSMLPIQSMDTLEDALEQLEDDEDPT